MSLPYRLLAVDVDGTLLNSKDELPAKNREALRQAQEAGLTVCLCTGRSLTETRRIINEIDLDLDTGVFVFGAIVSDLRQMATLHRTTIPADLVNRLVAFFQEQGYPVLLLYDESVVGFDYLLVNGDRNSDAYTRWLKMAPTRVERVEGWRPISHEPVRIGVIEEPDNIKSTLSALNAVFPDNELKVNSIYAPNYALHVVECFAPSVNKWHGISQLAKRIDIEPGEVVAVGDDINDMEMISQAGVGVAMANAIEAIKNQACWLAPSNDDSGVAVLVDRLLTGRMANRRLPKGEPR